LVREGYVKAARSAPRRELPRSAPLHYRSDDGYDIYVGRNNLQNDTLTLRFARADDLWLHAKEIPGSHVVIRARNGEVSDDALAAGALLAAWHSRGRDSSSVPVDYTRRRNVKKPAGAKPGYVVYAAHRTAVVTPDAARVARIKAVE
jgi:predicted ribosome quality control (RQC) complex YloA/Tae2 family protein